MKIRKCSYKDCEEARMKRPGNTTLYFKYCQTHQIEAVLNKSIYLIQKDKDELNKARKTNKKRTARKIFYSSAAWRNFSHYVLLFYADDDLEVRCSTNPLLKYPINDKRICVGHWIKVFDSNSSNYSTALEFKNVAPQSVQENIHFGGNMDIMKVWINNTHGEGTTDYLEQKKREPYKLDKYELNIISKKYLKLLNAELERRNIKNPWN